MIPVVIPVARDEQHCAEITVGKRSLSGDLATVVDKNGTCYSNFRPGNNQAIQVHHWAAALPEERVLGVTTDWKSSSN